MKYTNIYPPCTNNDDSTVTLVVRTGTSKLLPMEVTCDRVLFLFGSDTHKLALVGAEVDEPVCFPLLRVFDVHSGNNIYSDDSGFK